MRSTCHTALHGGTGAGGAQVGTEIDWMALPGINITLMYTGQEAVLYHTYGKFGLYLLNKSGMHSDFFDGPRPDAQSDVESDEGGATGAIDKRSTAGSVA
eukprot:gene17325-7705_t